MQIREREVAVFRERRRVIERVHRLVGLPCAYSRRDFAADERALQDSLARKRRLRDKIESEFIFTHGESAWRDQERERFPLHSSGGKATVAA
jgi:hypothetical protein